MAQGDSWDNPIIIGENAETPEEAWAEFETVNSANVLKYIKFKNIHTNNGAMSLAGSGTSDDPYIVSTYEELLFATGATKIWEPKLINKESRIYKYKVSEDNFIYCRWDDTPATVDLSAAGLYPSGMSALSVPNNVDFNGWTLSNILFPSETTGVTFNRGNKNVQFKRAFINNVESHYNELFALQMTECIVQINWFPPVNGYSHVFNNFSSTKCGEIIDCNIKVNCEKGDYNGTNYAVDIASVDSGGYALLYDTILDLDLKCGTFGQNSGYSHGVRLTRSVLKGSTTATQNDNNVIFDGNISAILDFATPNMNTMYWSGYNNSSVCIYNSDKTTWGYLPSSWKGVSTSELMNPAYLQSLDFSIGVDA